MNKIEMDKFISDMAKIYIQNPYLEINSDTIYSELMRYGISDDELKNNSLLNEFNNLQRHYNQGNVKAFVHPGQAKFLQLWNVKGDIDPENFIKIYLSFPKENMEECVQIIFDYIDKNNISSHSKLSNIIRSDSVVLRLESQNDAASVINFINNNAYLRSKAKPTNPFVGKHGICGFAYDELMSYNRVVSDLLSEYLNDLKGKNMLTSASTNDFYNFVNVAYQNKFVNMTKLQEFIEQENYDDANTRFRSVGHQINNRRKIEEMLLYKLSGRLDVNQYFGLYNHFKDSSVCLQEENIYNNAYIKIQARKYEQQQKVLNIKTGILNNYIEYELSQNQEERLYLQLNAFINEGKYTFITRTNGLRDAFKNSNMTGNDIMMITNNNIREYIKRYKEDKKYAFEYEKFKQASIEYFKKYGKEYFTKMFLKTYEENASMAYWYEKLLYDLGYEDTIPMDNAVINRLADQIEKNIGLERQETVK